MFVSYGKFWKNYANFSDETSRGDFWKAVLCDFFIALLLSIIFFIIDLALLGNTIFEFLSLTTDEVDISMVPVGAIIYLAILTLYFLATFVPRLSIAVRRLHNIGKSGLNVFWAFLPFIGGIILFVFFCKRSIYEG